MTESKPTTNTEFQARDCGEDLYICERSNWTMV